ncbi:MAG TPA: hypothetical protein VMG30_10875 [Acidobacteriota bacterium]|nr:hypothetical protein [Acidobacteriota bacterium]
MIQEEAAEKIHNQLLSALESARMRLSVAIAMEAKSTPRHRWQYYLETTDRMRRFAKQLRNTDMEELQSLGGWYRALETLSNLPDPARASCLCEILQGIVAELE